MINNIARLKRMPLYWWWWRRPDATVTIVIAISSLLGTYVCDQSLAPPPTPAPPQSIKVAALATKLDHWLQCSRMNLLLARQQSFEMAEAAAAAAAKHDPSLGGGDAIRETNDQRQAATLTGVGEQADQYRKNDGSGSEQQVSSQRQHSNQPAHCAPHFDGHLCWPQAQAGQQIQLPCPKIDYLPSEAASSASSPQDEQQSTQTSSATNLNSKSNQQQQQQQLSQPPQEPLAALAGPTGGDLNQSQEITLANLQSITPTGSRAGISSIAAMNQPPPPPGDMMIRQDGIARTATSTASDGSNNNNGPNSNSKQSNQGGREPLKYASRLCENAAPQQQQQAEVAQWQAVADYSACQPQDPTDQWVKLDDNESPDSRLFQNLTEQLERVEISIDPYSERALLEQWTYCIGEVMQRQAQQEQSNPPGFCPIIFDGWRCWPATRAGEIAYVNCPSNQPGFSTERKAYKICTLEADWYRHPETNRYWSNYTTCVDTVDLAFRTKILNLYVIGNLISLIALTVSLIIFVSFKSLKCTRVTIHKNLFLSFITNNLMWIIWYTYVVNDADLLRSNPLGCRVWHILLHYFLVSNYFWMFCEGLYLHTILVVAFVSEDKILKWFYLLGWLTPIPIIITYAYNRSYDAFHTNFCWMEESPHNIILMAPIGISLLLNLVFLINIVRVLVTKLRANNSPDTHQTRKAVRATLILIPLLGLHYMLMPFRPEAKSEWEMIYEIIAAVCTSFQGLCVAMLFCFCNGEVINVIKKKLKDTFLFNRRGKTRGAMRSRSNTTISNVFNNNSSMMTNHNNNSTNNGSGGANNNYLSQQNQQHHFERSLSMAAVGVVRPPAAAAAAAAPRPVAGNGNLLVLNHLQRQPLLADYTKPTTVVVVPGGAAAVEVNHATALPLSNQISGNGLSGSPRSSVVTTTTTTITQVSPVLQQLQKQQISAAVTTGQRHQETELTIGLGFGGYGGGPDSAKATGQQHHLAPHLADDIALEETVRLLQRQHESNNNNHRDEATA